MQGAEDVIGFVSVCAPTESIALVKKLDRVRGSHESLLELPKEKVRAQRRQTWTSVCRVLMNI